MEWLILVIVVPAILIPIVLLWGFAGCGASIADAGPVLMPTDVRAIGIDASVIALSWHNPNVVPVTFQAVRTPDGHSDPVCLNSPTPFSDTGLEPATTYFYQVRAFRISDNHSSALSDQAIGTTLGGPL